MGHRQTVQTTIRHCIMQCLIRILTVCLHNVLLKCSNDKMKIESLKCRSVCVLELTKEDSMKPTHVTECLKASYAAPCFLYFSSYIHAVFWYNSSNSLPVLYCKSSPTCRSILFTYNSNLQDMLILIITEIIPTRNTTLKTSYQ